MKNPTKAFTNNFISLFLSIIILCLILFLGAGCQNSKLPDEGDSIVADTNGADNNDADNNSADTNGGDSGGQVAIQTDDVNSVRFADVMGDVQFVKSNDTLWFQAVVGMQLNLNDTLATQVASEADLDVDQDKHVLVGEEVRLAIATLLKEVGNSKATALRVDTGTVYVRIQRKLEQDETFEVITPTCIMGVRGTHFVVEVLGGDTTISVIEGTVEGQLLAPTASDSDQPLTPQKDMAKFTVKANQRLVIPLGTQTEKEWIRSKLTPELLPVFVLTEIDKNSENLPNIYQKPLGGAIREAQEKAKISAATLGATRLTVSGARYVDPLTGHVYARFDRAGTFKEAKDWCEAQGGHLITISTAEEQAIAEGLMAQGPKSFYLIGLYQKTGAKEPNQGFVWVTEEMVTFERWHRENDVQTEPNNSGLDGASETHVTMVNAGPWPKGDWNDQNLNSLKGSYGLICEWESIADVRILPASELGGGQRDQLATTKPVDTTLTPAISQPTGITDPIGMTDPIGITKPTGTIKPIDITIAGEVTTLVPVTKPLVQPVTKPALQPVTTVATTTSATGLEALNWVTATAVQFPFNTRLMTYDLFMQQNLGDGIESLIKTIGIDVKTKTETQVKWVYTDGLRQLSVATVDGKIVSILQKNLIDSLCSQDFEVLAFRVRVSGLTTLEEVRQTMGTKGVIESKIQLDTGDMSTTWIWSDARGYIFAATVNETQNTFDSSFRNLK